MSGNESEVPSEIEKYIEAVETTAPQSVCLLRMDKSGQLTGKYFSEAPFLVSTTYGKIWQKIVNCITSSVHENSKLRTCCVHKLFLFLF